MATFDYQAARAAGATDEQIAAFLKSEEAEGRVIGIAAAPTGRVSGAPAGQMDPGGVDWPRRALAMLPGVGAGVGGGLGMVAGLRLGQPVRGAMSGAGVGGAAGRVTENFLLSAMGRQPGGGMTEGALGAVGAKMPGGLAGQALDVAGEGVGQAALEGVGGQAARLAAPAAKGLYGFALKMTKTVQKQFGDMAAVGLKRGLPVGKESVEVAGKGAEAVQREAGAAAASARGAARSASKSIRGEIKGEWSSAVGEVQRLLKEAEDTGVKISAFDLAKPLIAATERASGKPMEREARTRLIYMVRREANELLNRSGYGLEESKSVWFTPRETMLIRQAAGAKSKGVHVAHGRGDYTSRANPERLADIERGARESLEGIIPEIGAAQGRVGGLIDLRRAAVRGHRTGKLIDRSGNPLEETGDPLVDALLRRARGTFELGRATTSGRGWPGATGDPALDALVERSRGAVGLERAVESGRRAAPLHPQDWPGPTGDASLDALVGRSREAVGLERAMTDAASRQQPTMLPMMAGGAAFAGAHDPLGALLTALTARLALSPNTTSRLAIGANHSAAPDVLRQTPRTLEAIIEQLFMQDQQGGRP